MQKIYDELMNNTYEIVEDNLDNKQSNESNREIVDAPFCVDDFPDASSIFNLHENQSIEILNGFEDIVYNHLQKENQGIIKNTEKMDTMLSLKKTGENQEIIKNSQTKSKEIIEKCESKVRKLLKIMSVKVRKLLKTLRKWIQCFH